VVVEGLTAVGVQQVDLVGGHQPVAVTAAGVRTARDALGCDEARLRVRRELGNCRDDDLSALEVLDLDVGPDRWLERVAAQRREVVTDLRRVETGSGLEPDALVQAQEQDTAPVVAEGGQRLACALGEATAGRLGLDRRQVRGTPPQQPDQGRKVRVEQLSSHGLSIDLSAKVASKYRVFY